MRYEGMNKISYICLTFSLCSIVASSVYADSGSIAPLPVTSLHLESTTAIPSDADLQTTIQGGGSGTTIVACNVSNSTNCKGPNGTPTNGNNCVDTCTVTRTFSGSTFANQSCPAQYSAIAVYKSGTEYKPAPPPVYPIPNYASWQSYNNTPGWSCYDSQPPFTHGGGNQGDWCWSPNHTQMSYGYHDLAFCDGTPAVVRITNIWCPSPSGLSTDCNAGAWVWKYIGYYQICGPTGQYVANVSSTNPYPNMPTGIVCARMKTVWRP